MRKTDVVVALALGLRACSDDDRDGGAASSADVTPPSAPAQLVATVVHRAKLRLSWSASIDSGTGVAGYKVYRDGVRIASTVETSYQDDDVKPGQRYVYSVSSYDQAVPANESAQASPLKVSTTYMTEDPCAISGSPGLSAVDLSNSGNVLALGADDQYRWIIYRDGSVTNVYDGSRPIAVNESGDIIAVETQSDSSVPQSFVRKGFLYHAGTFTDLGRLAAMRRGPEI